MTKKDYNLIAKVMKKSFERDIKPSLNSFLNDLMYALQKENPKFDKDKFVEAVYGE